MNQKCRRVRLPTEIKRALGLIRHHQVGYDVVKGWLDSSDPHIPVGQLKKECRKVNQSLKSPKFAPMLATKLRLFQPSSEALRIIRDEVQSKHDFQLAYVEVAHDFITRTQKDASKLGRWFLGHLKALYSRQHVKKAPGQNTYYYHRRSGANGKRKGQVLVLYFDRKSKLAGPHKRSPCVHIEIRLSGAHAIESAGIFSVDDLIRFDHPSFWSKRVALTRFGSQTGLGELLGPEQAQLSGAALRKRAGVFRRAHSIEGAFVMQNAQLTNQSLKEVLDSIDLELFFGPVCASERQGS